MISLVVPLKLENVIGALGIDIMPSAVKIVTNIKKHKVTRRNDNVPTSFKVIVIDLPLIVLNIILMNIRLVPITIA